MAISSRVDVNSRTRFVGRPVLNQPSFTPPAEQQQRLADRICVVSEKLEKHDSKFTRLGGSMSFRPVDLGSGDSGGGIGTREDSILTKSAQVS